MIATDDMIALRPFMATLALGNTSQLLELTMDTLHIPANTVSITYCIIVGGGIHIIRDEPINCAVFRNNLG